MSSIPPSVDRLRRTLLATLPALPALVLPHAHVRATEQRSLEVPIVDRRAVTGGC